MPTVAIVSYIVANWVEHTSAAKKKYHKGEGYAEALDWDRTTHTAVA